jgi:hypothetical protein
MSYLSWFSRRYWFWLTQFTNCLSSAVRSVLLLRLTYGRDPVECSLAHELNHQIKLYLP